MLTRYEEVNGQYEYNADDIAKILRCLIQDKQFEERISLIQVFHISDFNLSEFQTLLFLEQENYYGDRVILLPIDMGLKRWGGIVVSRREHDRVVSVTCIGFSQDDPRLSDFAKIFPLQVLELNGIQKTDTGPVMLTVLLNLVAGRQNKLTFHVSEINQIRKYHVLLMELNDPTYRYYDYQRSGIRSFDRRSLWDAGVFDQRGEDVSPVYLTFSPENAVNACSAEDKRHLTEIITSCEGAIEALSEKVMLNDHAIVSQLILPLVEIFKCFHQLSWPVKNHAHYRVIPWKHFDCLNDMILKPEVKTVLVSYVTSVNLLKDEFVSITPFEMLKKIAIAIRDGGDIDLREREDALQSFIFLADFYLTQDIVRDLLWRSEALANVSNFQQREKLAFIRFLQVMGEYSNFFRFAGPMKNYRKYRDTLSHLYITQVLDHLCPFLDEDNQTLFQNARGVIQEIREELLRIEEECRWAAENVFQPREAWTSLKAFLNWMDQEAFFSSVDFTALDALRDQVMSCFPQSTPTTQGGGRSRRSNTQKAFVKNLCEDWIPETEKMKIRDELKKYQTVCEQILEMLGDDISCEGWEGLIQETRAFCTKWIYIKNRPYEPNLLFQKLSEKYDQNHELTTQTEWRKQEGKIRKFITYIDNWLSVLVFSGYDRNRVQELLDLCRYYSSGEPMREDLPSHRVLCQLMKRHKRVIAEAKQTGIEEEGQKRKQERLKGILRDIQTKTLIDPRQIQFMYQKFLEDLEKIGLNFFGIDFWRHPKNYLERVFLYLVERNPEENTNRQSRRHETVNRLYQFIAFILDLFPFPHTLDEILETHHGISLPGKKEEEKTRLQQHPTEYSSVQAYAEKEVYPMIENDRLAMQAQELLQVFLMEGLMKCASYPEIRVMEIASSERRGYFAHPDPSYSRILLGYINRGKEAHLKRIALSTVQAVFIYKLALEAIRFEDPSHSINREAVLKHFKDPRDESVESEDSEERQGDYSLLYAKPFCLSMGRSIGTPVSRAHRAYPSRSYSSSSPSSSGHQRKVEEDFSTVFILKELVRQAVEGMRSDKTLEEEQLTTSSSIHSIPEQAENRVENEPVVMASHFRCVIL